MPVNCQGTFVGGMSSKKRAVKQFVPRSVTQRRKSVAKRTANAYRDRRINRPMIQPFTETKDRSSGNFTAPEKLPNTSAFTIFTPDCFLFNNQGLGEGEMIGESLYSRFLSMKLLLEPTLNPGNRYASPFTYGIYNLLVG
jgi:hypothetical protein